MTSKAPSLNGCVVTMARTREQHLAAKREQMRAARQRDPEKHREATRKSFAKNKIFYRDRERANRYGITIDKLRSVLCDGAECEICHVKLDMNRPPKNRKIGPVIDHDHDSGKMRGVLCTKCNLALGGFCDDSTLLLSAAQYVYEHDGSSVPFADILRLSAGDMTLFDLMEKHNVK